MNTATNSKHAENQGICTGKARDKTCQGADLSLAQPSSTISKARFLAQPAKADADWSDLTRSSGDMLPWVISVCNCLSLSLCITGFRQSHRRDELFEKLQCQAGHEQAAPGTGNSWLLTKHQPNCGQAAACQSQHSKQSNRYRGSLLKVT